MFCVNISDAKCDLKIRSDWTKAKILAALRFARSQDARNTHAYQKCTKIDLDLIFTIIIIQVPMECVISNATIYAYIVILSMHSRSSYTVIYCNNNDNCNSYY